MLLRFRTAAQQAEVRGDFVHFHHPIGLSPAAGLGYQEATLHLSPGVYSYKFRTPDGAWHLDPENGRTRSVEGLRNSVLSVGGTDEPVLHAPVRPFLYIEEDGRTCVRAGLRRGAGDRMAVRLLEGDGDAGLDVPMRVRAGEDEHLLLQAHLPASARTLRYLFVLQDGRVVGAPGGGGQAFVVPRGDMLLHTPAWWRDAVLYTVFVDRFRRGAGPAWGDPPRSERDRHGGDLAGVVAALPYLVDLGVNALHLTPIVLSASAHRYDAIDPRQVDPALGGEAALHRLLDAAHEAGLRVLLDLALTHVHRDFAPFREVAAAGPDSPHAPWFRLRQHPFFEGHGPGYEHYQKGQWQEPLLALAEPEVADYLVETMAGWARRGVDGLRIDAAADVPIPLLRRMAEAVRQVRPDAVLFGEVIPENLARYTSPDGGALDAATDFAAQEALHEWLLGRRADARRTAAALARRSFRRGGPGWTSIGFTATHDQHRLRTRTGDARAARLGHLLVLLRADVPAIYYGDEVGLAAPAEAARDFEDAWPDRMPMPWDPAAWDDETRALFRAALRLRRERRALGHGDEDWPAVDHPQVLALRRQAGEEIVEAYLHGDEGRAEVALSPGPGGATVLLRLGEAEVDAQGRVALGPYAGLVLLRHEGPEAGALLQVARAHNQALCDLAFAEGALLSAALPAQLYLTVTEACNLRCLHCITDAPARTREGRARTMQPWLLDALAPALAAAGYFGMVHGGESLVAPIFWDLLGAIRRARAGRPCDVHLLSNGMLLREDTVRRLIDGGVTSLSVSLDGASAAVNDRIRAGGRMETVLAHLRGALVLRRRLGADLRIGVSTVVAIDNVAELPALGGICADLGVDWIKVEEMFPVNGFSRRQVVAPGGPGWAAVQEGMAALRAIAAASGMVVVDHLQPPAGCPCEADEVPGLREFRAADDFANRARFRPCSMPWELACVDPDGAVRPVDYYHPPLGHLLDTPFIELWNNEAARRLRERALRRIPAARRQGCPRRRQTEPRP